jgi:hypothetical protein
LRDDFFQSFSDEVFRLDSHIRFVGMASHEGELLGFRYRKDTPNPMTERELEKSLIPLVIQIQLYNRVREIAGELRYHVGTFERLYAAAVPVKENPKAEVYILMPLELGCRPERIMEDGLLPLIQRNRDYFL